MNVNYRKNGENTDRKEILLKKELLLKIENKTAIVGVIGLGYVGLPLSVEKAKAGYKTIGFDIQEKKVNWVNSGHNYIKDIANSDLQDVVGKGMLKATGDFSFIKGVDTVSICVPTPLDIYQQPDLSYIKDSAKQIAKYLHPGMLIILESTTYPGTTEQLIKPILETDSGLICGKDFFLAFSPERIDPGNPWYKVRNTPKIIGGITLDCTEVAECFYSHIIKSKIYTVSSPKVAEMEKIFENVFRYLNIALVNEMSIICNKMDINFWEVIEAAKTKPYGFMPFYPGPGVGGHCIPLDPFYLTWKVREYNYHTRLIELAGEINRSMPEYIVERISKILSLKFKKPLNGAKVLLLGVAYKKNIADLRESPALEIIKKLETEGAFVQYYDPYISEFSVIGKEYKSLKKLNIKAIKKSDILVIITAHSKVDYNLVAENAKMVFDTRNIIKSKKENIELL